MPITGKLYAKRETFQKFGAFLVVRTITMPKNGRGRIPLVSYVLTFYAVYVTPCSVVKIILQPISALVSTAFPKPVRDISSATKTV